MATSTKVLRNKKLMVSESFYDLPPHAAFTKDILIRVAYLFWHQNQLDRLFIFLIIFAPTVGPFRDFPLPKPCSYFKIQTWTFSLVRIFPQVIFHDVGERHVFAERSKDAENSDVAVRVSNRSVRHKRRVFRNQPFLGKC